MVPEQQRQIKEMNDMEKSLQQKTQKSYKNVGNLRIILFSYKGKTGSQSHCVEISKLLCK